MNPTSAADWLTMAEVAARLHVSSSTVHRMRQAGQIGYRRVPGIRRYRRSDVDAIARRIDQELAHGPAAR